MFQFELRLLTCFCCCVLISGLHAWQIPTAKHIHQSLDSCVVEGAGENAATTRCLMKQLGLWTDKYGYNARRIAKIFAAHNQMEEIMLLVTYCNTRERREEEPAQWAHKAYKCATAGRLGKWIKDYYKAKPERTFDYVVTKLEK